MAVGGSGKGIQIVVGTDYNDRDLKRAQRDLDRLKGQAAKTAGPMARLGNTLRSNVGPAMAMAAAAAGALAIKFAIDGVKAAAAEEAALVKLEQALSNVGAAHAIDEVNTFLDQMQRAVGISEDQLRPAYQKLVTATGDVTKAQELLSLALDISVATGRPLESITLALAKAANGQSTALRRLGVPLSDAAIKSGDLTLITQELSDAFGGQAAAAADTFQGQLSRLAIAAGEVQEAFGRGVLDAFGDTNDSTNEMMDAIESLEPIMYDLGENIGTLVKAMADLEEATSLVSAVFKGVIDVTGPTLDAIMVLYRVIALGQDPVEALKQQVFGLGDAGDAAAGGMNALKGEFGGGDFVKTATNDFEAFEEQVTDSEDALKQLNDEMKEFFGLLDDRSAARGFQQSIDDLRVSLRENGKSFDINTKAGRENQQNLDDIYDSAIKVADGQATAAEKVKTMSEASREANRVLAKMGVPKEVRDALLKPFDDAVIAFDTATTAAGNLKAAMEAIPTDIQVDVTVGTTYVGTPPPGGVKFPASGGIISSPQARGRGSDTVPAMLTPGEFVMRKSAVDKFGAGLFSQLNRGINPLAGMSAPGAGGGGGLTINGGITVNAVAGERADTSLPRALRRMVFLAGMNG